ncbi:MAG: diguanylate cyclase [bacterium]|nr:diguanylate cyclase [bacterium]
MTAACDICIIDDDEQQRKFMRSALDRLGFSWMDAADGKSGLELIQHRRPKVVLCDWMMPRMDGPTVLRRIREDPSLADLYFVIMTAHDSPNRKYEALEAGVDDYITKPVDLRELVARVKVGLRMWEMHNRLQHAAITDGLTGLYNHDHLNRILDNEWKRARRYGSPMSIIMMDIDYFKAVNDTYGHLVGNDVLEAVAAILRNTTRDVDFLGRFGGDEFAIAAPEATLDEAAALAERIRLTICERLDLEPLKDHILTASLGVASADDPRVHSAADLVELADRALYVCKRSGRNCVSTARDVQGEDEPSAPLVQQEEVEVLRKRVAVLSVQAKKVYVQSISALTQALEEKDPYSAKHSINVSHYAEQIAREMGCNEALVMSVRNAALLHDVGKVGIPDRVLLKPRSLNELEQNVMRQVPLISTRIVDHLHILESELHIIRHQHEYFNGSGYPAGLEAKQIPIGSRILLVADAFDAMTTDRVYRPRRSMAESLAELRRCSASQFDPRAVHTLEQLAARNRKTWQHRIDETVASVRLFTPASAPA